MITELGVIEKERNPFSCQSWVEQGFEFTEGRRRFLPALFGKDERTIRMKFSVNDGTYVAFVAIRWGYAEFVDGVLTATKKWNGITPDNLDTLIKNG